ncbi:MAG: flavodoxin family protein [Deltaproteobacteria bacterium]|nr:MAG: flavodoxin family protein [Deltaproteobacteria bacterium]
MKTLALNSSPRTGIQSKTELMLDHLVTGMKEAGAEVEVVNLRKKKINSCMGCFTCWTKTPGKCIHEDDMTNELYPKWLEADIAIYATPLYHYTMNATMKAFIERTLPVVEPFLREREGNTYHPLRQKHPKLCFLSVAGFPEPQVFNQLSAWVNFVYGQYGIVVGEIYRPLAEVLDLPFFREKVDDIFSATEQAGKEIVQAGKISPETMARITQPIVDDKKEFYEMGNKMWEACIEKGLTPKEFMEQLEG